jgi:hypothetical protein
MTTEQEMRGNIPIKQFDELVKTLKDEYGITMNERPQRIGEIRLAPIDYTSPQPSIMIEEWMSFVLFLSNLPKTYVIKQPKPTRWQRFKNKIKKLFK